jgi:hypothetical protein
MTADKGGRAVNLDGMTVPELRALAEAATAKAREKTEAAGRPRGDAGEAGGAGRRSRRPVESAAGCEEAQPRQRVRAGQIPRPKGEAWSGRSRSRNGWPMLKSRAGSGKNFTSDGCPE